MLRIQDEHQEAIQRHLLQDDQATHTESIAVVRSFEELLSAWSEGAALHCLIPHWDKRIYSVPKSLKQR